jgi:hypothetical protein
MSGIHRVACPKPQSNGAISIVLFNLFFTKLCGRFINKLLASVNFMKKINQISILLLFAVTITFTGCGVLGKSGGSKGCGCPSVYKKPVG